MIDSFRGEYAFLSNFYQCPVAYGGIRYTSSEAAYQAQKSESQSDKQILAALTAQDAKRFGRNVKLREDWDSVKDDVMYGVCNAKFKQNHNLMRQLINLRGEQLIDGNTWGDTYWGRCNYRGENKLGKILMRIRDEAIFEESFSRSVSTVKSNLVNWIDREFFEDGHGSKAVIGLPGGIGAPVAVKLCAEAMGKDRVLCVFMPLGASPHFSVTENFTDGVRRITVNMLTVLRAFTTELGLSVDTQIQTEEWGNLLANLRAVVLRSIARMSNGKIICPANMTDRINGAEFYGDFAPFKNFTSDEVTSIGMLCGLPDEMIFDKPSPVLNKYLRTGICDDSGRKSEFLSMVRKAQKADSPMPSFSYPKAELHSF